MDMGTLLKYILYERDIQEAHSYICSQLVSVEGELFVQSSRSYIEWFRVAKYSTHFMLANPLTALGRFFHMNSIKYTNA